MKKSKEQNIPSAGYRLTMEQGSDGYNMLDIEIIRDVTASHCDERVEILWQANRDTPLEFYGGRFNLKFDSVFHLDETIKLLKKITRQAKDNLGAESMLEALIALDGKVVRQVVYDRRLSNFVSVSDVKPNSFSRYIDDYEKAGYGGCYASCLAESEDEARRLITAQFAENPRYDDKFAAWLQAGRPIMRCRYSDPPDRITHIADVYSKVKADREKREAEWKAKQEAEQKRLEGERKAEEAAEQNPAVETV